MTTEQEYFLAGWNAAFDCYGNPIAAQNMAEALSDYERGKSWCAGIDWTRSDKEIAEEKDCHQIAIEMLRHKFAPEPEQPNSTR